MKNHNFYDVIMQFRFFFTRNILIITLYPLYVLTGHFQPLCYHFYKNAYITVVPIVPIWEHAIILRFYTFLKFFCNILIIYYFLCSVLKFHDFRSTNSRVGNEWVKPGRLSIIYVFNIY